MNQAQADRKMRAHDVATARWNAIGAMFTALGKLLTLLVVVALIALAIWATLEPHSVGADMARAAISLLAGRGG